MLLNIPVLDLLHSQLDIWVDPLSGKLTCNIRDVPSRLRQCHSSHSSDLALILQSSPEEGCPGTLCIRLSPAQDSVSGYSPVDMSEGSSTTSRWGTSGNHGLLFTAPPSHGLFGQPEHVVHSVTAEPQFLAAHVQGCFGNVDNTNATFGHSSGGPGSLDALMNQGTLWASPQENMSLQSNESHAMSPVSQTLSQISSGAITEGNLATAYKLVV